MWPTPPPKPATDNDVALGYIDAVQRFLECDARHKALVGFIRHGKES